MCLGCDLESWEGVQNKKDLGPGLLPPYVNSEGFVTFEIQIQPQVV